MTETTGHRLEKIVKNLSNLPSLPFIAHKISAITENNYSAIQDIAEVISIDQALSAKILKLVNSSFYGFSSKITTVSRAVVILGFQTLKTLAMGVSVFKTANAFQGGTLVFDMQKFWEHSLGVAAGSKLIARLTGYRESEEAFLAGLLHDIGKIILNEYMPNEFAQALHLAKTENLLLLDAENKIIQADHEIAGDYLAERWKLPFGLRKAILMHHNPPFREKYIPPDVLKLICIVNLANTLCKMRKIGFSGNEKITAKDEYVMQWMQIEENDIERFFLEIDKELATSKEFLGIITSTEGEEAAGEASSAMRPAVLLIYKNKERVLMPSLFVKNHGFDCHKLAHEAEQKPFPAYPNLKAVLVDELNSDEIAQLRTQIQKTGLTVPVHPLPLSFNSDEIQSFLESLHS